MKIKKIWFLLFAITLICALAAVAAVTLHIACDAKAENSEMMVTWKKNTGKPFVVEGIILRQGKPVASQHIDVITSSGVVVYRSLAGFC